MFEIDKQKFGIFIAELRKEKSLTQKELAQQLYVSDKAVSKWETGVSIPDTALLLPMADLFGVTVTELLMCRRMEPDKPMDAELVENVVKTAVSYSAEKPVRAYQIKNKWHLIYVLSFVIACIELVVSILNGYTSTGLILVAILSTIFGGYFCFFAVIKLPAYYDENRIHTYADAFFHMSYPGIAFNNNNWPHILKAVRIWSIVSMVAYPFLNYLLATLLPGMWLAELFVLLPSVLGGLFIPVYVVGKRYE